MQQPRKSLLVLRDLREICADPSARGVLLGAGAQTQRGRDCGAVHSATHQIGQEIETTGLQNK